MSIVRVFENSMEYDGGDDMGSTSLGRSPIEAVGSLKRSHGHGRSSFRGQDPQVQRN